MIKEIKIGNKRIGYSDYVYIIAEIGSNHNQDLNTALKMIELAAEAGADAVKFQSLSYSELYAKGTESKEFENFFGNIELNESWYKKLSDHAKNNNIDFLSAPTYDRALEMLIDLDVKALKIASPQVAENLDLLKKAAATGLPLFLSLGYCTYSDIENVINICNQQKNDNFILMHCISQYPTNPKKVNLSFIKTLKKITQKPIGFSDHSLGAHIPIASVAMGARVIEKHITLDTKSKGPDHHFSMNMYDFKKMVREIREVSESLGDGIKKPFDTEEHNLRNSFVMKAVAIKDILPNTNLSKDNIIFLRTSKEGLSNRELKKLEFFKSKKLIKKDEVLNWPDIQGS